MCVCVCVQVGAAHSPEAQFEPHRIELELKSSFLLPNIRSNGKGGEEMGAMHVTLHGVGKLLWEEKLQLECPKFLNKGPKMTSQIVLNH